MPYSVDAVTDGCYDGTLCLKNKFNIKDEKVLKELETALTFDKITQYNLNPLFDTFDVEHYKSIHKYVFGDIYEWAGEYRTVNITKKGTSFAAAETIENLMVQCFNRLNNMNNFQGLNFNDFLENIVDFYCVTNRIHPFREGNGRTQRLFLSQIVNLNGYNLDFSLIDSDELMIATIQSANGITDNLKNIFKTQLSNIN